MRAFYSALFYLLIPFILCRLLWRSIKAPAYRCRWRERLAYYTKPYAPGVIWFHAVSVGEAEALFPLIRQIQNLHPDARLLITTTTPTGSARVKAVLQESVEHVYLPYDTPGAVSRFMRCFKPVIAVIVETEIWPNLFACCGGNGIPLYLINARLSEKSMRGYQKIPSLVRPALAQVKLIAAQTQDDADRFIAIGAEKQRVTVAGNIKFDVEIADETIGRGRQLKQDLFKRRYIWLIASTHKDEEAIFLDSYKQIKPQIPELLLVLVPRHPERFGEVRKLCEQQRLAVVTRTSGDDCRQDTDVYLADTMGELKMLYAAADVVFVGGSMVPVGGHNMLEPAAIGVPALFGPFIANFKEIAGGMLAHDAAIQCQDKDEIVKTIYQLYKDAAYGASLVAKAKAFVRRNQGAKARLSKMLDQAITQIVR
ncbi:MAG: lipid IV(A) 3-deoxy-D-manno-octulosonic acid transferase [Methylobacter sp.]|uniref:lipid IV(A) 3-deoxy-D-manno-octulosonic acid transferase n=1 Tax=Methylobacter sp. TaxID=2051955 RepID=UPI00258BF7D8|nr:lipid IV(A) 3-deoxy-D-manno-octulosonic acid transferase [Methylobacter sp.]MCL7420571.1 lipid IV(A) 3-deoxy-D-manno-octulosonic acid transferase [Methylobacter sp.]